MLDPFGDYPHSLAAFYRNDQWEDPPHSITLIGARDAQRGERAVVASVEMKMVADGERYESPSLRLGKSATQHLFDQLWQDGFRPSVEVGSHAAEVDALKDHVVSLRRILEIDNA